MISAVAVRASVAGFQVTNRLVDEADDRGGDPVELRTLDHRRGLVAVSTSVGGSVEHAGRALEVGAVAARDVVAAVVAAAAEHDEADSEGRKRSEGSGSRHSWVTPAEKERRAPR
ncbi:MAG: hypothetical protein IPJ34_11785 [Myxococcales bacterium]|nr:hypothetical protein [Myxococcales bacterium]